MKNSRGTESETAEQRHPVLSEYGRLAAEYDARWASYIEATNAATLARLSCGAGTRLLDVGCGTGVLLGAIREREPVIALTGIDPSREMLDVARARLAPDVALHAAWAEALPFADDMFETVVSNNMFHFIRHPAASLAEMRRVLCPGGQLVLTDWCDDYWVSKFHDWYLRLFSSAHHRTYGAVSLRRLLAQAGFVVERVDRFKISALWGMMTAVATKPRD